MANIENGLRKLSERIGEHSETIQTEEAAKTSAVLPFLQALGYDVFDPSEVIPEYTADTYGKKGEKVDYAIAREGDIAILIECKGLNTQLNEKHLSQLFRYFTVTSARFAILTNGREYRFYSDLEESNKLDKKPFFVFDLLDYSQGAVEELSKFSQDNFNVSNILSQAERLKYVAIVKKAIGRWMENPPDSLVRLVVQDVYDGRMNKEVREAVAGAIPVAFRQILRDHVRTRLSTALDEPQPDDAEEQTAPSEISSEIITTEEEIEGWLTARAIVSNTVDPQRVHIRDAKSYCAVLMDDNNRRPLVRLYFNRSKKYLGLFDGDKEEKVEIGAPSDIYQFTDRIRATATKY